MSSDLSGQYLVASEQLDQLVNLAHRLSASGRSSILRWICGVRFRPASLLADRALEQCRQLALKTAKQVSLDVSGFNHSVDLPQFEVLSSVLIHALSNAVVHGIDVQGRVAVSLRLDGYRWRLEVRDDGRGATPDVLSSAMSPGFSTRSVPGDLAGRGIGLSAVADSVRAMGGRVDLDSNPGKGFGLKVELPVNSFAAEVRRVESLGRIFWIPASELLLSSNGHEGFQCRVAGRVSIDASSVGEPELLPFFRVDRSLIGSGMHSGQESWILDWLSLAPPNSEWFAAIDDLPGIWLDAGLAAACSDAGAL